MMGGRTASISASARSWARGDGIGAARYEARLTVTDPKDRVVYDASGEAQCGA